MRNEVNCPVCNSSAECEHYHQNAIFYGCPVCGRFEITYAGRSLLRDPKLAHYLFHNRFPYDDYEYRYHTTLEKEVCDSDNIGLDESALNGGRPVHMDKEIIESWYPKNFSERIDRILLRINQMAHHIGQRVRIGSSELYSLLFIDRVNENSYSDRPDRRDEEDCINEACYMLECLKDNHYISTTSGPSNLPPIIDIKLTSRGYSRVDELHKNTSNGRNVLVAMKFGNETTLLREAIRQGIQAAGFIAVFIDEVEHIDFITPELLKHIRDSKFVVVDLTHQNNGAYFEEGYAMGLGKPVIQLCKRDTKLHFDIAQKNTIIWESENDIPERLENRIRATID